MSTPADDSRSEPTRQGAAPGLIWFGVVAALAAAFCYFNGINPLRELAGLVPPPAIAPGHLPACGDKALTDRAVEVFADGPSGRALGLRIIDLADPKEIARSATEVRCTATVRLNSAAQRPARYRAFVEGDKSFIEITID
jgi:hypothetical protein